MVCSILRICKIWQKGPSMNHRGPHQFCVLLTNRKLGEGRRKGEEEEGRKKMREGKGRGPPHLLGSFSSCFSTPADTFIPMCSRPVSAAPRPLNTSFPKPGMASPSPGPDLQVCLLHPESKVCVTVVWSYVPPPLGCTSDSLHTVCPPPRGSFKLVALG